MMIAKQLKSLRIKHQYTQEDLAQKLDVSRQTISKWETGTAVPDVSHLSKLSDIYNISLDEILGKQKETEKRYFFFDMILLSLGIIGFIIFGILLLNGAIDETSSTITLNAYGIFVFIFLAIMIYALIIIIKRYGKK